MMEHQEIKVLAARLVEEMESRHSADMAPKWTGGTLMVVPADASMKAYEMPVEKFMHKIVMMRDNLRVLEQQINANSELTEGEKLKLQGYITKCYGSMTSFNVLFRHDEDKM
ncbi:MAG: hypothetical protein ACKO9V_05215 [Candidatus Kapaibacterium sp.]